VAGLHRRRDARRRVGLDAHERRPLARFEPGAEPRGGRRSEGSHPQRDHDQVGCRYVELRERGDAPCAHDLLAVAGEFGDSAVVKLRTVLAVYEALRASEDSAG
jgi:hypothetical protein